MSFAETVLLGAIAGSTIFLGLPFVRVKDVDERLCIALAMFSFGILRLHLHGRERAMPRKSSTRRCGEFKAAEHRLRARARSVRAARRRLRRWGRPASPPPSALCRRPGEAAASRAADATVRLGSEELASYDAQAMEARRRFAAQGMTIALAIGLHNFAEGLVIGVSARGRRAQPRDCARSRLGSAQRDRGLRHRRAARRRAPVVVVARPRRADRRRPDVPRHDRRLPGASERSSSASTRSPAARSVRRRRDLDEHAQIRHRTLGPDLLAAGFLVGVAMTSL